MIHFRPTDPVNVIPSCTPTPLGPHAEIVIVLWRFRLLPWIFLGEEFEGTPHRIGLPLYPKVREHRIMERPPCPQIREGGVLKSMIRIHVEPEAVGLSMDNWVRHLHLHLLSVLLHHQVVFNLPNPEPVRGLWGGREVGVGGMRLEGILVPDQQRVAPRAVLLSSPAIAIAIILVEIFHC